MRMLPVLMIVLCGCLPSPVPSATKESVTDTSGFVVTDFDKPKAQAETSPIESPPAPVSETSLPPESEAGVSENTPVPTLDEPINADQGQVFNKPFTGPDGTVYYDGFSVRPPMVSDDDAISLEELVMLQQELRDIGNGTDYPTINLYMSSKKKGVCPPCDKAFAWWVSCTGPEPPKYAFIDDLDEWGQPKRKFVIRVLYPDDPRYPKWVKTTPTLHWNGKDGPKMIEGWYGGEHLVKSWEGTQ